MASSKRGSLAAPDPVAEDAAAMAAADEAPAVQADGEEPQVDNAGEAAEEAEGTVDEYLTEEMKVRNAELDAIAAEIEAAYSAALSGAADGVGRPLTEQVVGASLSNLGHNAAGRPVFTTATLTSLSLTDVGALAKFQHLQKILLDANQLESVAPLSGCHSLVHVSLANNRLTESVFTQLAGAADTLQHIDLSHNRLESLSGVAQFRFLNTLLADGNAITTLRATNEVARLPSLWKLSLVENKIAHIETGAFISCPLRLLDLSKNQLGDAHALLDLTRTLTVLGLEDNALMHLNDVVRFSELSTVSLAGNNLYDMAEVHSLASLNLLRNLTLIGNPLCSFGAMPDAPLDDDAASDVVCRDDDDDDDVVVAGSKRPLAANVAGAAAARPSDEADAEPARVIPSARHAPALRKSQNAPFQPKLPQQADDEQLERLSEEERYRLHVVWRVPQLAVLDGVEVTPDEAVDARTLVGGVDREARSNAERLLQRPAAGSAVQAARASRAV